MRWFRLRKASRNNGELLIGSYFLAEYSLESAALFNPSIVPHPDQTGLAAGALRFILSLRATGEGHISSITFRTGIIHRRSSASTYPHPPASLTEPRQIPNPRYEKGLFARKLQELGLMNDFTHRVMASSAIPSRSTICAPGSRPSSSGSRMRCRRKIRSSHQSDLDVGPVQLRGAIPSGAGSCRERILFPATPSQRNGIEDARFVRFQNDDGTLVYYATYTAYDGKLVLPELVETSDFLRFRFITLNGPAVQNKGMALFPRKINGHYAMLSRQDNENIFLMFSDNVHFWNEHQVLLKPEFPWELIQIGNCGSPIETDAGWLVLSHGVGPMRKYCIGAFLLDRDDPTKVIGRLREPLLIPNRNEREGYVPNVVYTCGAVVHQGELVIPYGLADHATGFATVPLDEVLAAMQPGDA